MLLFLQTMNYDKFQIYFMKLMFSRKVFQINFQKIEDDTVEKFLKSERKLPNRYYIVNVNNFL